MVYLACTFPPTGGMRRYGKNTLQKYTRASSALRGTIVSPTKVLMLKC